MSRRLAEGFIGRRRRPRAGRRCEAVVALGANLGDRAATLDAALADLRAAAARRRRARLGGRSRRSRCKPDGPDAAAPAYLNAVALVTTRLAPSCCWPTCRRSRRDTAGSGASAGATAPSTSTSSPTATCAAAIRRADPAAPARRRARLRARALAVARPGCRAAGRRPRRRRCSRGLQGISVKRTGAGILLARRGARRRRRASCSTRCSPRRGGATFTPAVTLPILLVLLGAIVVALALPIRRATRGHDWRAGQPVPGAADRDAREGVEHRRRRRRRVRGRARALPADPPRRAVGRLVGRDHRDGRVRRRCS